MSLWTRLEELRASARYHRRRLDRYATSGGDAGRANPERLEELERESRRADARVVRAEADFAQPEEPGGPPPN